MNAQGIRKVIHLLAVLAQISAIPAISESYLMWQIPNGPTFPIYVYSNGAQVGFLYASSQQAIVGQYTPGNTNASYKLYYTDGSAWHSCSVLLANGTPTGTCPGLVINPPAAGSNVYTLALGAGTWPSISPPSPAPANVNYGRRQITFINDTENYMIQIGEWCTTTANPHNPNCVNLENKFQIKRGDKSVFTVDSQEAEGNYFPAGLISYAFTLTGYQKFATSPIVSTGGYGPGGQPYATKIEATSLPVTTVNRVEIPKGSTNWDISAVDGFNTNVISYPETPTYCTYTVPPEESNVLGAGLYGPKNPLNSLLMAFPQKLCASSSQLPPGKPGSPWDLLVSDAAGNYQGCMSPCTFATKTNNSQAQLFCCTGPYDSPTRCDQPSGKLGANNSTYVQNLGPVSHNVYRFAFDDAIGDFACPAETNFVVRFVDI